MKALSGVLGFAMAVTASQAIAQAAAPVNPVLRNPTVYRVTYTLTEMDAGKKIGVLHYSLVLTEGGRSTVKNGSKVPVATGSYMSAPGASAQTQFTYLDVGINLDTTLALPVDGTWQLKLKVEQSLVAEDKLISGVNEPVIRQSVLEETTSVTLGKPQVVGTLDFSGSTRHLEVEVLLEPLK